MHGTDMWQMARRTVMALALAAAATWCAGGAAHAAAPRAIPLAGQPGGDIPDSAVYLSYHGRSFSVDYVEGWLQTITAHGVSFNDKDSSVVVELRPRLSESLTAYVQRTDLPRLAHTAGFRRGALTHDSIARYTTLRLVYRGRSAPDAVTGKTVVLQNDRYYISGAHALAVITLSTPLGVDNVDGFRRIAHSFRFH